ncbi:peptidoglycan D,D-transpeptidase FtsI family protein [Salsuginibacillus kocurii]|uniref:peptidoglycan D,D-transpeptidase FtsI family protein n=1 Tax=Salsuginibacillus kocurii TaxID=427078 RepID=UPI0003684820|nr:penicillin-binding protein 2 [Salsuginibacillus kocurii]
MGKQTKKALPAMRLNVLFFVVFLLFLTLILRLGYIQIVEGEEYQEELQATQQASAQIDAPRGLMYDRHGNVVVNNDLVLSLTYTNTPNNEKERLKVSEQLTKYIEVTEDDIDNITERELKDYWLQTREDEAASLIDQEDIEELEEEDDLIYERQLDRVTEEHLADIDDEEMETVALWRQTLGGYNHAPHRVTSVETEEAHAISEDLENLPNVDLLRDAERSYPYGDTFPTFFGGTGSIPRESINEYMARGYERSDIIGTTFLESQYENVLRGEKGLRETVLGDTGPTVNETPGSRGNDLVLSIDMALQQEVESIIREEVEASPGAFLAEEEAYVVLMDPSTGEILSMAGYDEHLGTVSSSFEMGSSIKAATMLAGFSSGVIDHGTIINDTPIDLPGTPPISSWRSFGPINDIKALEVSSNIYMAEIAMRLSGFQGGTNWGDYPSAYQTLRNYYHEFGLGIDTGIDLPSETTGIDGGVADPGNLLFMSFGQFDTYTPLQLAQYIATIANDGYRMQPQLVKQIREPSIGDDDLGAVITQNTPQVMNRISASDADINRVQEGLRHVVEGSEGTAVADFEGTQYTLAAKTGTAQVSVNGQNGNNQTLVGYAPYEDPEVAFAVVVPNARIQDQGGRSGIANSIARRILDGFFEVQEERPDPEEASEGTTQDEYQDGAEELEE